MECIPRKAFFHPGELVELEVTFETAASGSLEATIFHLAEPISSWTVGVNGRNAIMSGSVPAVAPCGYGVEVRWFDAKGDMVAHTATAFDVLAHWTQAPRYGFLSEFGPDRHNETETMAWARRYHLNGLQYYDWQFRHESLLPSTEIYADLLGRMLSLNTVRRLIDAGHASGVAAMPYTAVYGASDAFYRAHPEMALHDSFGNPLRLGEAFLVIMNSAPDALWTTHLLGEFMKVLESTGFDGIHIDQYGPPFVGVDAQGQRVDLADAFPAFINATAKLVSEVRGNKNDNNNCTGVVFNAVGNWPVENIARAAVDIVYIEVWSPYRDFEDLHRIIVNAQQAAPDKRVVIAVYIDPECAVNWRLADAIIFASGGYHLELGEPGAMLADPYFPKFGHLGSANQEILSRYYDFLVRYGEVLSMQASPATDRASAVTVIAHPDVLPIIRQGNKVEAVNLINFTGLPHHHWDLLLSQEPTPLTDLMVRIQTKRAVERIWWASPDREDITARPLGFRSHPNYIEFEIPEIVYWKLIVLEYSQ